MEGASMQPLEITSRLVMLRFRKAETFWPCLHRITDATIDARTLFFVHLHTGLYLYVALSHLLSLFHILCLVVDSGVKGIIIASNFQGVMIAKRFHLQMNRFR